MFAGWSLLARICAPLIIVGLLAAAVWGYGARQKHAGRAEVRAEWDAAVLKATLQARQREQQWQSDVEVLEDVHQTELRRVAAERDRAVLSLRNRPANRLPAASSAACAGAGPEQLSRADADVALWLAAEADKLRADYSACRAYIDAVRR